MTNENRALEQANTQMASVRAMVAALELDYDRLDELKDEQAAFDTPAEYAAEYPEDAGELAELAELAGDCESEDDARQRITEDALSVEVRTGWTTPGDDAELDEFRILLCTGGPAVQIRGELDEHGEPCRAWLEYQDWWTGWRVAETETSDMDALLSYARCFYFGQ